MSTTEDVVHAYYAAWAARDQQAAAALLAPDFRLVSVWGIWEKAAHYLEEFARLSAGIAAIEFIREVYDGEEAFVLFRIAMDSDSSFIGTDLLRVAGGKVRELVNVNSGDPAALAGLVD